MIITQCCNIPTPLPVELIDFSGQCNEKGNQLNWTTITELNNQQFIIERLVSSVEWEEVGSVLGEGNST